MGWGKALSAVVVMSISVMLVVSVLPVGAAGNGNGNGKSPLMMVYHEPPNGCTIDSDKCPVFVDTNHNGICEPLLDKMIMLPAKKALDLEECKFQ